MVWSIFIYLSLSEFNTTRYLEGLNLSITFTNASKLIWNDEKIGNLTSIRNEWPEKTRPIHVATIIVFLSGAFQVWNWQFVRWKSIIFMIFS